MSALLAQLPRLFRGALLLAVAWLAPSPAAAAPSGFDHYSTGFELIGQHELVPCEGCHVGGIFKGTPHDCASCHTAGARFGATAKPTTHILSSNDCSLCHTPFGWRPVAMFDHTNMVGTCATCHDNVQTQGKPKNHIPTTQDCSSCHLMALPWSAANFTHAGITGNCASCHDGIHAPGKPASHLPTATACETCHTSRTFKSWTGTTMNHAGITENCQNCHETGMSWYGVSMVDRPTATQDPSHPTKATAPDCSTCHTGFAAGDFSNVSGKPPGHIPTAAPCAQCHTTPGKYALYVMGATGHAGITSGCATCHAAGLKFLNMAPPTLKEPPANHLPINGTACETCHSNSNFVAFGPATAMNHAGITKNCQNCHETGMSWYGVTTVDRPTSAQDPKHPTAAQGPDCSSCHTGFAVGDFNKNAKPANHIPTNAACAQCHMAIPNFVTYVMGATGHTGITTGCATCHAAGLSFANMAPPTLKEPPANHLPINGTACETCHSNSNFVAFGPGTAMNHAGIAKNCQSCHETGMSWFGVTMVDRPTAAQDPNHPTAAHGPDCSTCHTGFALGDFNNIAKPPNHIPTGAACNLCHTAIPNYAAYVMGAAGHTGITSGCATCHAAGLSFANMVPPTLKEPPANHLPINGTACETCHSNSNFVAFGPGTAMNHAGITKNCQNCHETGMSWFGVTMVDRPTPAQDPNHPTAAQGPDCSSCHTGFAVGNFNNVTKPPNHIPTTAACAQCHNAIPNYASYVMGATGHAGITSGCASCHAAGLSFANMAPPTLKEPPANHLPINGTACETCHSNSNFVAFGPGTAMSHAGITKNCQSCHETAMSWYGVTMVDRPTPAQDPNHPTAAQGPDCSTCHTGFAVGDFNNVSKPPNHIPTTAACAQCHNAIPNYASYVMGATGHTGIRTGCATCHAAGLSFANMAPPALKEPPANHLPINGTACETCHSNSNFVAFGPGTAMSHAGITKNCQNCHETGMSWYGVTMVDRPTPAQDPNHPTAAQGPDCSACHTGFAVGAFNNVTIKPPNHIPTSANCSQCHTTPGNYAVYTGGATLHTGITSNCIQCHGKGTGPFAGAPGFAIKQPPANHIPTKTAACEGCHSRANFTTFSGTTIHHAAVPYPTFACDSCHETGMSWFGVTMVDRPPGHHVGQDCYPCHQPSDTGQGFSDSAKPGPTAKSAHRASATAVAGAATAAIGPPAGHPRTTGNCAGCHGAALKGGLSTGVARVDHMEALGSCQSCHDGIHAPAKPANHPLSGSNCDTCHTTSAWNPAVFDHSQVVSGTCITCHNGLHAVAKPANHPATQMSCDSCHYVLAWTPQRPALVRKQPVRATPKPPIPHTRTPAGPAAPP